MTRIELAKKLKVSTESMKKFIRDFDLDLNDCLFPNMNVKEKFEKFATENEEFLQKYEQYLHQSKSVEDIAENLKKTTSGGKRRC